MSDQHRRALRRLNIATVFIVGVVTGMLLIVGAGLGDALPGVEEATPSTTTRQAEFRQVPPCDDLDGQVVNDLADIPSCISDDGRTQYSPSGSYRCDDGLVIWWSNVAWGYLGRPAHTHPDNVTFAVPDEDWARCTSSP